MSGRNAKLLARYAAAMRVRDGERRIIGLRPRAIKRAWNALSAKERYKARAEMERVIGR